ncbi:MAG: hypothetical protein HZC02_03065 [Candidatus Levybacteria bacterium]|nr:hypothetical protein [Candidatus Levybacteria bacterium]
MFDRERFNPIQPEDDRPHESCGLVTLYSTTLDTQRQVDHVLRAGYGVQHRGQQGAGIAYPTREGIRYFVGNGLLPDVFTSNIVKGFNEENPGHWMQLHTRYGTDQQAGFEEQNLQPVIAHAPDGSQLSFMHNGQFTGKDEIRSLVKEYSGKEYPDDVSDSFLVAQLLANSPGDTWEEKIIHGLNQVNGAFSVSIGVKDMIFLARDQFGFRPHVVGKLGDGWVAASETLALQKIGVKTERSLLRGEIVRIDHRGLETIQEGLLGQGNFCDFELAYFEDVRSLFPTFNSPDDSFHPERWMSNYEARKLAGIYLAQKSKDKMKDLDFITAVLDSGGPFGAGLAIGAGLPYEPIIIRDHVDPKAKPRLFQGSNIDLIPHQIGGKLSLVPGSVRGKRVGVGDDSNVRGNVNTEVNKQMRDDGAIVIRDFFGYPMVLHTCHLGVSLHTKNELVAARNNGDLDAIARELGADSVDYVSHSDFIKARKNGGDILTPKDIRNIFLENGGCGGCLTGRYPIDEQGVIFDYKSQDN